MYRLSYVELGELRINENIIYKNFYSVNEIIDFLYENIKIIDIYTFEIEEINK